MMNINFWKSTNYTTGGSIYNDLIIEVLADEYTINVVEPIDYSGRGNTYLQFLITYLKSLIISGNTLNIIDFGASRWVSRFMPGKKILIMHHYDENESEKKQKKKFLWNRFLKLAKDTQKVVVVAEYWKDYLEKFGIQNVEVVYNSFEIEKYKNFTKKDDFYKRYDLPLKPILYIGKNSINKTLPTYKELIDFEDKYLLVTSGKRKEFEGPVHLELSFEDYISLLHHAHLAVLYAPFKEGWNRIAHEALLCGTPIVGSSFGGLGELLNLANQPTIDNIDKIEDKVEKELIKKRNITSKELRKFDLIYFKKKWRNLVRSALKI